VKSLLAIVFIAGVAGGAIMLATKKTHIRGEVMAASMMDAVAAKGIIKIDCDPDIPITNVGAVFDCTFAHRDGSTAKFHYVMNRAGKLDQKYFDSSTRAPAKHRELEPGEDPWKTDDSD
jgi:hypothetical protein